MFADAMAAPRGRAAEPPRAASRRAGGTPRQAKRAPRRTADGRSTRSPRRRARARGGFATAELHRRRWRSRASFRSARAHGARSRTARPADDGAHARAAIAAEGHADVSLVPARTPTDGCSRARAGHAQKGHTASHQRSPRGAPVRLRKSFQAGPRRRRARPPRTRRCRARRGAAGARRTAEEHGRYFSAGHRSRSSPCARLLRAALIARRYEPGAGAGARAEAAAPAPGPAEAASRAQAGSAAGRRRADTSGVEVTGEVRREENLRRRAGGRSTPTESGGEGRSSAGIRASRGKQSARRDKESKALWSDSHPSRMIATRRGDSIVSR